MPRFYLGNLNDLTGFSCSARLRPKPSPDKFYKGSQEENTSPTAGFFLNVQPAPLSRVVLGFRSIDSERYEYSYVAVCFFSTSGFHHFFVTKPVSSETSKAERWSNCGDHSSIWDSWPIAFSGYPRGPRVGCSIKGVKKKTHLLRPDF